MLFEDWDSIYSQIANDLSLSKDRDEYAADVMEEMMKKRKKTEVDELDKRLRGKFAVVFGAGPSLKDDARDFEKPNDRFAVLAADGAAECLMSYGKRPDVIVTDLDGNIGYILEASRQGSLIVVHAHGDNIHLLRKYVDLFEGDIIATTQVKERMHVHNFGGFTDGDRAAVISASFGASSIILAGMDFGDYVGRYSKPYLVQEVKADARKAIKLKWGKRILEMLAQREVERIKFFNATLAGEELKGYKRIRIDELGEIE
jgi:uncharacterized Rossmann fold enzyme